MNAETPNGTILVVDDNPTNLSVLFSYLSNQAFTVLVAESGEDALEIVGPAGFKFVKASDTEEALTHVSASRPDLIFINGMMLEDEKDFNGLRQIRQSLTSEQVLLAVSDDAEDRQVTLSTLCDDILSTPVHPEDILKKLEVYLGLEWVEKDAGEKSGFAVPPADDLQRLHKLALRGHITKIIEEVDRLEQSDAQYATFAEKLRQFADAFQVRMIREFLNKFLKLD